MRRIAAGAVPLVLVAGLACRDVDQREATARADSAAAAVREEAREGMQRAREDVAREYSAEWREEFTGDIRRKLNQIDGDIAAWERETRRLANEARTRAIADIRQVHRLVDRRLAGLDTASARNWDDLRVSIKKAVDSLQRSFDRARGNAGPMGGREAGQS